MHDIRNYFITFFVAYFANIGLNEKFCLINDPHDSTKHFKEKISFLYKDIARVLSACLQLRVIVSLINILLSSLTYLTKQKYTSLQRIQRFITVGII